MDNEPNALISLRIDDPRSWPVPGSIQGTCTECGHKVWLSPASQGTLTKMPSLPILCLTCAAPKLQSGKVDILTQEGQTKELAESLGKCYQKLAAEPDA
jgi:hypothetical protein